MKKLFSRLALFAFISFTIYGLYICALGYVFNHSGLFKLPADKQALILGSSHTACDINDTLLNNVFNLSHPADGICNSYDKLKKILPLNPQIHTVLLGISEGDIARQSAYNEDAHKSMSFHIDNYFYLMAPGEFLYLVAYNPREALNALVSLPRSRTLLGIHILRSRATLNDLNLGKYEYIAGQINFDKELKKFAKNKDDASGVSEWQIDYLHKIVTFCNSRHVKLIFTRMPENKIYARKNEKIFLDLLRNQFADVPFKDYVAMPLPDSCFQDHDHLNYHGAIIMTDSLRGYLKTIDIM